MPSTYPTSIDSFTANTDDVDDVLAEDVNELQDAIEAIETKLGTGSSTPANDKILKGNGAGSSAWDLDFKDEDDMVSNSATAVPSQQSTKAYVDGRTPAATDAATGVVELATNAETLAGTDTARAITPSNLKAFFDNWFLSKILVFSQMYPDGLTGFSTTSTTGDYVITTKFGYVSGLFFGEIPSGKKVYIKIAVRANITSGQTAKFYLNEFASVMSTFDCVGTGANQNYTSAWIEVPGLDDGDQITLMCKVTGGTITGANKLNIAFAYGD